MRFIYLIVVASAGFSLGIQTADAQSTKTFGNWKVECKIDKMSDKRGCQIGLPLDPEQGSTGPRIGASLMTLDLGRKFIVMTGVPPIAAQIRVDKNKQHAILCRQWCEVSESERLAKELSGGAQILAIITTVRGNTEGSVSSGSYERALQEAKRWVSGEAPQPQPKKAPAQKAPATKANP